jgi:hypothetical protein
VNNALFIGLDTGEYGGAIFLGSNCGATSVTDTAIIACKATKGGGAIGHGGNTLTILRVCIRSTTAPTYGSAVDSWSSKNARTIDNSQFVLTGTTSATTAGTILSEASATFTLRSCNFSECRLATTAKGSAFQDQATGGGLSVSYCTVYTCSGHSGIATVLTSRPTIDHCNFLSNLLASGVLWGQSAGLTVTSCIFSSNRKDIQMDSGKSKYRLTNCVFQGAFPDSSRQQ